MSDETTRETADKIVDLLSEAQRCLNEAAALAGFETDFGGRIADLGLPIALFRVEVEQAIEDYG